MGGFGEALLIEVTQPGQGSGDLGRQHPGLPVTLLVSIDSLANSVVLLHLVCTQVWEGHDDVHRPGRRSRLTPGLLFLEGT